MLSIKSLALATTAFVLGGSLASGVAIAAIDAPSKGRYELTNGADTTITTIVVRNAECLNAEDSAATLKMVQAPQGYAPHRGLATYRCVRP